MVPVPRVGWVGVTATAVNVAAVTVTLVEPLTPDKVAETAATPGEAPVTSPFEPAASLTLATAIAEDSQLAVPVTS